MSKKVQSTFTFGLFLLIIGIVGKFLNWKQADIIMALGIMFELLATLLFIWNKIKNKK
jgi:divalent metal cation (Fe/Co/Zn/Cd) transporter